MTQPNKPPEDPPSAAGGTRPAADSAGARTPPKEVATGQGQLNTVSLGPAFEFHPTVFPVAALIIIVLVGAAIFLPGQTDSLFASVQNRIVTSFGWLYVLAMSGFLALAVWLGYGRFASVKLGDDDEKPEFPRLTWFAMLFSAGMGIGLLFWSVAEPIYHFTDPPSGRGGGLDDARQAMALTIFHWGLHPWALYAVVALALGYFGFRQKLPLSFRSLLYPVFGKRVHGPIGDVVDILAVVATLVGVATSLGLGAMQVNAGLNFLLGVPTNDLVRIGLIAGITAVATVSVVLGLHTGIRRLSELNMALAAVLLLFVIFGGGTLFFLNALVENVGSYLQTIPHNSFWTGTFEEDGREWLGSWTIFYWGWWIAWSPFVGTFIARISRGRTFREFITGVLLVPVGVSIIWLTAFGASVLEQDLTAGPNTGEDFPVQVRSDEGLPVAESGAIVGPKDGLYERLEGQPDSLRHLGSGQLVTVTQDGRILDEEGEPFDPPGASDYTGAFAFETERLTAVEYLQEPVLNSSHTQLLDRIPTVLFVLLSSYPLVWLTASIATLCIILFFVTSSDSASMVIDIIASGGNPDPPVGTRLFWAITEGAVAAALLVGGGLQALQTASITAALPFVFVLLLACGSLVRGLFLYETSRAKLD